MVVTVVPFDYIGDLKSQQVGYSDHVCLLSEWFAIQMLSTMVFRLQFFKDWYSESPFEYWSATRKPGTMASGILATW